MLAAVAKRSQESLQIGDKVNYNQLNKVRWQRS